MTFFCSHFSPKEVNSLRRARGHFVMLIQSGMHLTECNPGLICENNARHLSKSF